MGVLFCTYSLLNQKSKSTKEVAREVERNPTAFADVNISDIHERKAAHEASKAELEFGEAQLPSCRQSSSCPSQSNAISTPVIVPESSFPSVSALSMLFDSSNRIFSL